MSKKALIIGATGLVGGHLVQELLIDDQFSEVVVLGRRSTNVKHVKLTEYIIDFDDVDSYKNLVKGDVLFSCLGTTMKQAGSKEVQWKIDYSFQFEIAEAARKNGVQTMVLVSSSGASSKSKVFYSRMKGKLEEAIQKLQFPETLVFQPSLLLGDREEVRRGEKAGELIGVFLTKYIMKKYRPIKGLEVARAMKNAYLSAGLKSYQVFELDAIFDLL